MLIPSITLSDFKRLKANQLKEMKSCIVTCDGEYLFTAIIPPSNGGMSITDNIKTQAEYLGHRGTTVGGKDPEELISKEVAYAEL
ncbi:hypothetical protein ACFLXA_02905 [Chloroflexota bacterium]